MCEGYNFDRDDCKNINENYCVNYFYDDTTKGGDRLIYNSCICTFQVDEPSEYCKTFPQIYCKDKFKTEKEIDECLCSTWLDKSFCDPDRTPSPT